MILSVLVSVRFSKYSKDSHMPLIWKCLHFAYAKMWEIIPYSHLVHEFQVQVELASYEFNKLIIRNLKKMRGNIMRGYCLMRLKYFY